MVYLLRLIKFYFFILNFFFLLYGGICLPRLKRSNNGNTLTLTTSFYDKLKQSLAPLLQQSTNLNSDITILSNGDHNGSNNKKRFSTNSSKRSIKRNKHHKNIRKSYYKPKLNSDKRSSSCHKAYPTADKYNVISKLDPHISNQSSLTVSEHEIDYDSGDMDLPDIDEPPAHIFEYNRANNTNKNNKKIGQAFDTLSPYQNYPINFHANLSKHNTAIPVSLYDKCRKNLEPLVNAINLTLSSTKLHQKNIKRAKLHKGIIDNLLNKNANSKCQSLRQQSYGSLYDQFKKRLEDFSSELGINAGLTSEKQSLGITSNNCDSESTFIKKNNLRDLSEIANNAVELTDEFKKAKKIVERLESHEFSNPNSQQQFYADLKSKQKSNQKRSNLNSKLTKKQATTNVINPVKDYFGSDFDFWVEQRGYLNKDHKVKPVKQHNYERFYNNARHYPDIVGYANVNGICDCNENLKHTSNSKQLNKHADEKMRSFRNIDNMAEKFLGIKTHGTDGSSHNKIFPEVLAEPLYTGFSPPFNMSARSLLENIAHKLNISTLDVAKKVAGIQDLNLSTLNKEPELHNILQQYIENSVISAAKSAQVVGKSKIDPQIGKQAKTFKFPKFNFNDPNLKSLDPNPLQIKNRGYDPLDKLQISTLPPLLTDCNFGAPTTTECEMLPDDIPKTYSTPKTYNIPDECVTSSTDNGCPWEQTTPLPKPYPIQIPKETTMKPLEKINKPPKITEGEGKCSLSQDQISRILEKLLTKIEEIQFEKSKNDKIECDAETRNPLEDTPCKLSGSWLSTAMGLRFDITVSNETEYALEPEAKRQILNICVQEWLPPRPHCIIDTDWPFTGSTLKETGGPFYLYTQKRSENILATFVGFCRSCGGMDTIFGTWAFSFPSKSCQDTSASFQVKNDVMRRYTLEDKRKERYKNLLYRQSKFCNTKQ